jgi:DMSO/TMAO reductase YedYZ molybdopterin-dependent catalytic subunit
MSSPVSHGFRHRRHPSLDEEGRVPPGQYVTQGFPVLSAGPTPHTPLPEWTFSIRQDGGTLKSWTWQKFQALPAESVMVDIHCVTRWTKLGTVWRAYPWTRCWSTWSTTRRTCWPSATAAIPRT